jgi:hypothetical protein
MTRGGNGSLGSRGRYQSTQWVNHQQAPTIPDYDFENPVQSSFLNCANSSLAICYGRFGSSPTSLNNCIYGFLTSSRLLPPSVTALADDVRIQTSGAFAVGLSHPCEVSTSNQGHPEMVSYF